MEQGSDYEKSDAGSISCAAHVTAGEPEPGSSVIVNGDYPEGVWRAWSTVIGAWLILCCSVGMTSAFGVYQDFYVSDRLSNYSASSISWIGGVQIFLELILGPIGGKLFDVGYIRAANIAGCTLFTLSFFMLSLSQPQQYYQVFLAQGVGMGAGIGILYVPASAVVSHHFRSHRALAMSILLNHLMHGPVGFVGGTRIVASITLICFVLGNVLISVPRIQRPAVTPKTTFLDAPYILTVSWGFVASLGMYFPAFYLQLFARIHGIHSRLAFYSLAIMNAASVFCRVLPNWLADVWGKMEVFVPCATIGGLVAFGMIGCTTPLRIVIFAISYGFFFGASVALYLPVIDSMTPPGADTGKRMGMALVPVGIACLVGPPTAGAILGSQHQWWKGIVFASVTDTAPCVLLGAALVIWRRSRDRGEINKV
ncbi:MFS general substrate transporter [Artomyces pyxidatus]|uniref:MFS general substrate transporter n=1 Tax=Artomyces pyxidatus TaxID=48021 RepID=A0ACB8TFI5_9AGAM|nr:MFS general substrate transporter [Artomyces pyxidatus]